MNEKDMKSALTLFLTTSYLITFANSDYTGYALLIGSPNFTIFM